MDALLPKIALKRSRFEWLYGPGNQRRSKGGASTVRLPQEGRLDHAGGAFECIYVVVEGEPIFEFKPIGHLQ
jgi:hypothetical protein